MSNSVDVMAVDETPRPSDYVVGQTTADGAVLINMSTGDCFELNRSGAKIWSLLASGNSVSAIAAAVAADHGIAAEAVEADVRALLAELGRRGLVRPSSR